MVRTRYPGLGMTGFVRTDLVQSNTLLRDLSKILVCGRHVRQTRYFRERCVANSVNIRMDRSYAVGSGLVLIALRSGMG